jgi:hypothetical protein
MRVSALVVLMALNLGGLSAQAADCRDISHAAERSRLQRYLSSKGFSKSDQTFLLNGSNKRIRELPQSGLNTLGAACGVKAVRAQVLGCLNNLLPSSVPTADRKTGKTFWGKANVSARASLVIGTFHICRAGVMEKFYSAK